MEKTLLRCIKLYIKIIKRYPIIKYLNNKIKNTKL